MTDDQLNHILNDKKLKFLNDKIEITVVTLACEQLAL